MDTASANQVWAERFTVAFEPKRLFELEECIASRVADIYGVVARTMTARADGRRIERPTSCEAVLRCFHCQLRLLPAEHALATQDLERAADD